MATLVVCSHETCMVSLHASTALECPRGTLWHEAQHFLICHSAMQEPKHAEMYTSYENTECTL